MLYLQVIPSWCNAIYMYGNLIKASDIWHLASYDMFICTFAVST